MFDFDEIENPTNDEGIEEGGMNESGEKKKKGGDDVEGWEIEDDSEEEENM